MSPDGSTIVYASPRSGRGDIYRVERDGSNLVRLTDDPNYEGDPQYSADGKRIVFIRETVGVGHIWIMDADGSNQHQLTAGAEYDHGPSFSRDGSKIVFTRRMGDRMLVRDAAAAEIFVIMPMGLGRRD
jgi:TolB protein